MQFAIWWIFKNAPEET